MPRIEIAKDCLTGNYLCVNHDTKERFTYDPHSKQQIPSWAEHDLRSTIATSDLIERLGKRDREPYKVDDDGFVNRPGDQWFTWGLLRSKKTGLTWQLQACVQIEDDHGIARHATMVGYGDTEDIARNTLLDQMYEMKATIEDAITNVQAQTKGTKKPRSK